MTETSALVFGPTGDVGSATARFAEQQGAKVFLAVRDLQKPVPGLSAEQERDGRFERVKADLNDAASVSAAVAQTGATRAFIYLVHGGEPGMGSAVAALKSAGIRFVVFLGSLSFQGDPRRVPPGDLISWSHAQVEIKLAETFGSDGYVAARPAFFASNILWWKEALRTGTVRIPFPDAEFDWIVPADIGRVCGTLLARPEAVAGALAEPNVVYLTGPRVLSQRAALEDVARALGRDIQVIGVDEDEGVEEMKKIDVPEPIARSAVHQWKKRASNEDGLYQGSLFEQAASKIEKVTGRPPTTFQGWLDENKHKFGI